MKKILTLAAAVAAFSIPAFSQSTISFSPEAGINLANIHERDKDASGNSKNNNGGIKLGVKAGVNADIWIKQRLSVQPGLFYSIKGAKYDGTANVYNVTFDKQNNITLHYFEVPVNLEYYFNDPGEGRFFVGVGAYIGVAFSGKNLGTRSTSATTTADTTLKYKFGDDYSNNNLRRFDFGASGNIGYLLRSGIFFRGAYQLGITNMAPGGNRPAQVGTGSGVAVVDKLTNSVFTISVGYKIGSAGDGKKKKSDAATEGTM